MDTLQKKILCPSILNLSTDNMREEIEKLDATDMDIYHVDIMDGTFVPNFGMSVRELEMIRRITDAGHHKLVDCHMMVMNPHRYIKRIAEAGADIIYIHPESELIPSATLELSGVKTNILASGDSPPSGGSSPVSKGISTLFWSPMQENTSFMRLSS